MKKLLFLILFLVLVSAKPPELTPYRVKSKVSEILKAHVSYKELDSELMKRVIQNFLEELDPTKTYFIETEIARFLEPDEETLQVVLRDFQKGKFSLFEEMQSLFVSVIARKNGIEENQENQALPQGVKSEEFKDLGWAESKEKLEERILRIRALQTETTEKLGEEQQARFFQRLQKRKFNREADFLQGSEKEKAQLMLSYVMKAITCALDSHTNYFTPKEANQFMIQVQQRLFGIGAQLRDDLDGLSVMRILENSPASRSNKLKIGDKIIAVNQEPVVGMEITEAVELIRGEQGTKVGLTILRKTGEEPEKLEVELTRGEIVLEETRLETQVEPFGDGVIAICKLFSFYQDPKNSSSLDIRRALEKIQQEHVLKGVLLDLRGNAGGLLTQAVNVTGLFINKGIVVSIKDNTGQIKHLREVDGKPVWEGPLAVLVDKASASAAEIVAQTLQDYGRALVMGDKHTFGKGSFQTFTLDPVRNPKVNPQGEYKVTRGRYYTVSGKSPQLIGVQSDIVIPGILSELDIGEEFAKYPLENDVISPNFEDDLSDISPWHRLQLGPMYKYNLQQKLTSYDPYLKNLQTNSTNRIKANPNYQAFLKELEKENFDSERIELFAQSDLQLIEALNVVKDLIFLVKCNE